MKTDEEKAKEVGKITARFHKTIVKPINKEMASARNRSQKNHAKIKMDQSHMDWWDEVKHLFIK